MNPINTYGSRLHAFSSLPPDILNLIVIRCGARQTPEWRSVLLSLVAVQKGVENLLRPQITEVRLAKRVQILNRMQGDELADHFEQVCQYFDKERLNMLPPIPLEALKTFTPVVRELPEGKKPAAFEALCARLNHSDIGRKECASVLLGMAIHLKPQFDAPSGPHRELLSQMDELDRHHIAFESKLCVLLKPPYKAAAMIGALDEFLEAAKVSETELVVQRAIGSSLHGFLWCQPIAKKLLDFREPSHPQRSARLSALMQTQAIHSGWSPKAKAVALLESLSVWCDASKSVESGEKAGFFAQAFNIIDTMNVQPQPEQMARAASLGCLLLKEFCTWHAQQDAPYPALANSMLRLTTSWGLSNLLIHGPADSRDQLYQLLTSLVDDESFKLSFLFDCVAILGAYPIIRVSMSETHCLRLLLPLGIRVNQTSSAPLDLGALTPGCGLEVIDSFTVQIREELILQMHMQMQMQMQKMQMQAGLHQQSPDPS